MLFREGACLLFAAKAPRLERELERAQTVAKAAADAMLWFAAKMDDEQQIACRACGGVLDDAHELAGHTEACRVRRIAEAVGRIGAALAGAEGER